MSASSAATATPCSRVSRARPHPANHNGAGQIVAAGALASLAALAESPVAGTRVIPLQVAGAFHTRYMAPAVETLRAAADVAASDPASPSGPTATAPVDTETPPLDLLVAQVASPVRWDLCMESFADHGVTGIIELAPAGTLVGLAKRALRGVPTVAVKTPTTSRPRPPC
jgi:[acyl-carrier-protein] S-malonyltransferase